MDTVDASFVKPGRCITKGVLVLPSTAACASLYVNVPCTHFDEM